MSALKFEKNRVPATLTLTTGETVSGCFFVVGALARGGPERVGDILNNTDDKFFPFRRADGGTRLYSRAHVVLVTLQPGSTEAEMEPGYSIASRQPVEITLSTGTTIEGMVFVDQPADHDRLSDCAHGWKPFLYITTPTKTLIVNTNHVVDIVERAA